MTLRFTLREAPDLHERSPEEILFEFRQFPVTVGRGANNNIILTDPTRTVSRNHVRISEKEGRVVIEDLESKNFTYLNNERLNPHEEYFLREGDMVQCGDFTLRIDVLDTRLGLHWDDSVDFTAADTQVVLDEFINNPFDDVVDDLLQLLEQLSLMYNDAKPAVRDAMLADAINRSVEQVEKSSRVIHVIADSVSKTGLLRKELGIPTQQRNEIVKNGP